jgi:hypothetical protein
VCYVFPSASFTLLLLLLHLVREMRNNAPNMQRCLTNKCVRLVVRILCVWGARAGATDAVLVIKFADGCGGIKIEAGDADEESDAFVNY